MSARLRLGIVGCGEVAQVIHLPTLHHLRELFAVTALCDVSEAVREGVGERWGVARRFADHRAMLDGAEIDAVLVANPHP
ncbi:MAG: Gfo/Idh/MocA family oxidoreductase, partial [Acetobacteraceae bacterium]|nr:Gfo/Idh/MocA family oxidoreductase [Acetobacteraceae bacterium]